MIGLKNVALGSKALVKEATISPPYFIKNSTIANILFIQFTSWGQGLFHICSPYPFDLYRLLPTSATGYCSSAFAKLRNFVHPQKLLDVYEMAAITACQFIIFSPKKMTRKFSKCMPKPYELPSVFKRFSYREPMNGQNGMNYSPLPVSFLRGLLQPPACLLPVLTCGAAVTVKAPCLSPA